MDRVVEALLSAVASLEDFLQLYSHEQLAINALEEITDKPRHDDSGQTPHVR